MEVRIAGMAWLPRGDLGPSGAARLRKQLTIVPKKFRTYGEDVPPAPLHTYVETGDEFGVPRAYFFQTARGEHTCKLDLVDGHPIEVESLLRQEGPYAEQATAMEALLGHFRSFDGTQESGAALGAILQGKTGFGKTNTALAIAHALGRTTLIIVHKEFLLRQWVSRIKRYMPGAKVGIVQQGVCDFEGKDFVIAMVHSLGSEDGTRYPAEFYNWPGLIVIDEVHRIGAPTWSPVPQFFAAKYRLGLTATPRRKDGLDKVFWWNIGEIEYEAQTEMPKVGIRKIHAHLPIPAFLKSASISPSVVENKLVTQADRNELIIREIVGALRSPQGRKLMVLSKRLDHLRVLNNMLLQQCKASGIEEPTTGYYVGAWFTGEKTFSAKGLSLPLKDEEREKLIAALYRHFRRKTNKMGEKCAEKKEHVFQKLKDGKVVSEWKGKAHFVQLYNNDFRERVLEEVSGIGLLSMARDYKVAQTKSKETTKARTEEELYEAERSRVIWATYQMCAEGVDIPAVDTLIWAMPISDIEQAAGRGRRFCIPVRHGGLTRVEDCEHLCPWRAETCEGKAPVVAADIVNLRLPMEAKREKWRDRFYSDEQFTVVVVSG